MQNEKGNDVFDDSCFEFVVFYLVCMNNNDNSHSTFEMKTRPNESIAKRHVRERERAKGKTEIKNEREKNVRKSN